MNPRLSNFFAIVLGMGCALPGVAGAQQDALKVFVLAGQSNMVGKRSSVDELKDDSLKKPQEKVLFFTGAGWEPLGPGVSEPAGFGPELSFGQAMQAALGEPVGIIKHSAGGTNLHQQWDPEGEKSLYNQLRSRVEAAREHRKIEVVGMLWMQGESDAKNEEMAKAYAENLTGLIEAARMDFGTPVMSFVMGRIHVPEEKFPWVEMVREAQTGSPLPMVGWIDCDDLDQVSDRVHYTTGGYVEMGRRFAERMKAMQGR